MVNKKFMSCLMRLFAAFFLCVFVGHGIGYAQDEAPRGLTIDEYNMVLDAKVDDLDNDTYIKIGDGNYVLDRYEMKPAYSIAGENGVKKRLDLYKLLDRSTMAELGLVVFYTNTASGETFNLTIPNMASSAEVWKMYFDAIYEHDQQEEDVALKMSYVLSKEVAYLLQKSSGVDMSVMEQGNSDYDFCFPATALVTLADNQQVSIADIEVGDQIASYEQGAYRLVTVEEVQIHQKSSISLTSVQLVPEEEVTASLANTMTAGIVQLVATPNHPILTKEGTLALEDLMVGKQVYRYEAITNSFVTYRVAQVNHLYDTVKQVYNLETSGDTYLVNGVVVLEK